MEKDDEVAGDGNSYTAEYWQYDSRLGRRFNIDPRPNPSISVYACFGNNPIWLSDEFGDSITKERTKGKNFMVMPTRQMAKAERHDGQHNWLTSAYTWDRLKGKMMRFFSFGKLKLIEADNAKDAVDQIINKLGEKGFVKNIIIDYHAGDFGDESLRGSIKEISRLAGGYSGDATTCYLGQCWGGGNVASGFPTDFTGDISKALDGATTYGNQAAASSIHFFFLNTFIGKFPEDYSKRSSNAEKIGIHTVSKYNSQTGRLLRYNTSHGIYIKNTGKIHMSIMMKKGVSPNYEIIEHYKYRLIE